MARQSGHLDLRARDKTHLDFCARARDIYYFLPLELMRPGNVKACLTPKNVESTNI
jgi:hypothetical protein